MKFAHSLQFNCVPEWTEHYLNYGSLKRALYALERAYYEKELKDAGADKAARFETLDREFKAAFLQDVEKVMGFYHQMERQCHEDFAKLPESDVETLYITLNDLVYYLELNREGFLKLVQKYQQYIAKGEHGEISAAVEEKLPLEDVADLRVMISKIEKDHGAGRNLKELLRERVVFERSTVWQEMVEMERRTSPLQVVQESAAAAPTTTVSTPDIEKSASVKPAAAHGHGAMKASARAKKILAPLFSLAVFVALWFLPVFEEPHLNRAMAMVIFTIVLWCTEAVPLYATAMLVPFLVVLCGVFPPGPLKGTHFHTERPGEVAKYIFSKMFSETIMLLLGGFSLAAALTKYGIAKMVSTAVIGRAGRNPGVVLMVVMAITAVASLIISNVAAPVLTFSLIQPLLRALSVDHPLAKSLVVGVAYAANVGGLTSPIASPQNLFAMKYLGDKELTFGQWMAASVPVAILCLITTWVVLRVSYRTSAPVPDVLRVKATGEKFTGQQWFVVIVSLITMGLWMTATSTKNYFGGIGVLAVFPMVAFFGSSLLSKDDFNGFLWNVVMLAMGGSAIGTVVSDSGLLTVISKAISAQIEGMGVWQVCAIFSALMLVVATFVSHSVSSIIMTPVVLEVANGMVKNGHPAYTPQLMVAVVTFICSIGMGMPISGFPNITAMSLEDGAGRTYIQAVDFFKTGIAASILATGVVLSVGYIIFRFVL